MTVAEISCRIDIAAWKAMNRAALRIIVTLTHEIEFLCVSEKTQKSRVRLGDLLSAVVACLLN